MNNAQSHHDCCHDAHSRLSRWTKSRNWSFECISVWNSVTHTISVSYSLWARNNISATWSPYTAMSGQRASSHLTTDSVKSIEEGCQVNEHSRTPTLPHVMKMEVEWSSRAVFSSVSSILQLFHLAIPHHIHPQYRHEWAIGQPSTCLDRLWGKHSLSTLPYVLAKPTRWPD